MVYLLSPYDLIPGMHGLGWIDDILVLFLLYRYLKKFKQRIPGQPPPFDQQHQEPPHNKTNASSSTTSRKTPYEILGVSPNASQGEIKSAYRELAGQYHPDKVSHLGEEFQKLAHRRFQEIQEAYDQLYRKEK